MSMTIERCRVSTFCVVISRGIYGRLELELLDVAYDIIPFIEDAGRRRSL